MDFETSANAAADRHGLRGREKSACGVGFVAARNGKANHEILQQALSALSCVEHRGACGADRQTGDGAGIMAAIPFKLLGYEHGSVAVATLFVPAERESRRKLLRIFEDVFAFWAMPVLRYREVPIDKTVLGSQALSTLPFIVQAVLQRPSHCNTDASFDKLLYTAKQMALTKMREAGMYNRFFLASLSANTIVYKALTTSEALSRFYPDLLNPEFETSFAMFHRRFSTNTVTGWDKAQPFRMIGHNGEINTIDGNRSWAYSREKSMGLPPNELLTHTGISDSGSLNEMAEALLYRSSIQHIEDALALMMPPAGNTNSFYKFWGRAMEPWDGPALITFCDGETIGARLDRNGFRPCRWALTDDRLYLSSEAGSFKIDQSTIIEKGALRAGNSVTLDLQSGKLSFLDPQDSQENKDAKLETHLTSLHYSSPAAEAFDAEKMFLFGVQEEEISRIMDPMIAEGKEPIGSMGDTAALAILSDQPRSFFDYFFQNFAQVTNPPLDYLRERSVTDLSIVLGAKPNIFAKKELIPPPQAVELSSPILSLGQTEAIYAGKLLYRQQSIFTADMTFRRLYGAVDFRAKIDQVVNDAIEAVKKGAAIIVISDRNADWENLSIPALIMLRALVKSLDRAGLRLKASIVVDTAQARTTHHVSALISFGAVAVCPWLALQYARSKAPAIDSGADKAEKNLLKALEGGLLKVMSKMGISVVRAYQSSKLFTIIGLDKDFCHDYFRDVPSPIGGIGLEEIVEEQLRQAEAHEAAAERKKHLQTYQFREHPRGNAGEMHSMTNARSRIVHQLVRDTGLRLNNMALFGEYLQASGGTDGTPVSLRHLLDLKPADNPLTTDKVQDLASVLKTFGSGAMSFGAISAEAQRDIILAMLETGGRSNSGEGGENPYYFTEGITGTVKQIASGRFGVTATYIITAKEIQIKMAQGAKPGEGGQLMAPKVNEDIARARHSMVGVDLISPPPMHDIYSIEDLKQLIYELRQINPGAPVGVKLVSGAHIGTIAVGVAKAGADIIHISGSDGGTGAAPLSSMKHTGLPWELGLAEAHRALEENGLRNSIRLRTDGGLLTGKDVIIAAILGADDFDFGKLLLVAQGCVMARICEKNTCPTGIATHDARFKAKYKGSKDHIIRILEYLAEDVRGHLANLGIADLQSLRGQNHLLETADRHLALINRKRIDLDILLAPSPKAEAELIPNLSAEISVLNKQLLDDCRASLKSNSKISLRYEISTDDRAAGATLAGEIARIRHLAHLHKLGKPGGAEIQPYTSTLQLNFKGSAGQGFGVFLEDGMEMRLSGEANDSVCKTMSGGKAIIKPAAESRFKAADNVILGNCALYGATGGKLMVCGIAGDRFAVRNSGAIAIAEGTGLHACEYMTNGLVVILGNVAGNLGSGMTGGKIVLYKPQPQAVNTEYIAEAPLNNFDLEELKALLEDYFTETQSATATRILENWETEKDVFKKYVPVNELKKAEVAEAIIAEAAAMLKEQE
ncbi:MAG: glutamate synthase large subunit [Bacteroidota bacterium]